MFLIERFKENPLLSPNPENDWEDDSTFNGSLIRDKDKIVLIYRAISSPKEIKGKTLKVSSIGYAESYDGLNFKNRRQLIIPEKEWESFGCEDPRITKIDDKYYIFYTAISEYPFSAKGIKIGLAITKDFNSFEKHPVTTFNSKAMSLFPERIGGKLAAILSVNTDSPPVKNCIALFDKEEDIYSPSYWERWYHSIDRYTIPLEKGTKDLVEAGAPPIKTKYGWLIIYANIRDYHSSAPNIYGIEAALLDLEDPRKIIGRTDDPLLIPTEDYELHGKVPNVIFPSGSLLKGEDLYIYYGAADTSLCGAKVSFDNLAEDIYRNSKRMVWFERYKNNPILEPTTKNAWESRAVFNPASVFLGGKVHILYRAMSKDNTSVIGYASSKDGFNIDERLPYPVYLPREDFEKKSRPNDFSGCEDPRIVEIGDSLYITYTAYNGKAPRIALSSIEKKDFLSQKWNWKKPILISPPDVENKNCVIFPEMVNRKYVFLHRPDNRDIWIDFVSDLKLSREEWLGGRVLIQPRKGSWDSLRIGAAAPPIKTKDGWLLIYHGLSETSKYYRVGALFLDLNNPRRVIARTRDPLLEPRMFYEEEGQVRNVVFPCGATLLDNKLLIYYGGADSVVCVASISLEKLMQALFLQ